MSRKRACVIVLGDVGRSPRMQYHTISLSNSGYDVDLVGYSGSRCQNAVNDSENITIEYLHEVPDWVGKMPRLLAYGFKVIIQTFWMLWTLFSLDRPDVYLVQNPPSIPTLPVVWFVSKLRRSKFVVDWHNYGFTILELSLHKDHILVKICRFCEGFFGYRADAHLCVTNAMRLDLLKRCATVLYDRPPGVFKPIGQEEKLSIFEKLAPQYASFSKLVSPETPTAFVISSTSWTEDEDFQVLLDALQLYGEKVCMNDKLPRLVCAITGKGPLKEFYKQIIEESNFSNVDIVLPWLEPDDYPILVAAADLGVCLHTSSSALDLPMKVVDMFGCAVPVCAIKFECLSELVQHDVNGLHFSDSHELAEQFEFLLSNSNTLTKFRNNLKTKYANLRWEQSWQENALPVISE